MYLEMLSILKLINVSLGPSDGHFVSASRATQASEELVYI